VLVVLVPPVEVVGARVVEPWVERVVEVVLFCDVLVAVVYGG